MKGYELLFIIKPNLSEDEIDDICKNVQSWITEPKGEITLFDQIGIRDLATEFKKHTQGYYVQCQFNADQKVLDNLNEKLRVSETIIRYLNVTLESIEGDEVSVEEETETASA